MLRMSYYQSMLSSKNKIFQSIIKSIQPENDQGSNAEFVQTMADLNAKFSRITQECQQWDNVCIYLYTYITYLLCYSIIKKRLYYLEITTNVTMLA